jgi:post-segregation antitoxin (ccd killing protein)
MEKIITQKTRTTVSVDATVMADVRKYGVNLSRLCEEQAALEVSRLRAERWAIDNADAIRAHNEDVERNGVLLGDQGVW